jgi:hypothetical protein
MRFRVAEINNRPTAIFSSKDARRNERLSQLLSPSTEFIAHLLYNITRVERGFDSDYSYSSMNRIVYIQLLKERITIQSYEEAHDKKVPPIEIPVERAKLLLFQWGLTLQRWEMKRKKAGI